MELNAGTFEQLVRAAERAAENAYAPYSQFHVGAALLLADGAVVTGCNVENASYGLTSCAERNAVFRAVAERGVKLRGADMRIIAIAVANLNAAPSSPCGACRQVLSEFVTEDAVVVFPGEGGVAGAPVPFRELFPYSFGLEPILRPGPTSRPEPIF